MEQKRLKSDLSRGELKNAYLLHGKEVFLISHYANEIEKHCGADEKIVFDGAATAEQIIMAAETVSFSGTGERLIVVRDSKFFAAQKKSEDSDAPATGRKADAEKLADYLKKIPPDTVILFIEADVDKRTRLYKSIAETGSATELVPLAPHELAKWLAHYAKQNGKKFAPGAEQLLLRTCGTDMYTLKNETDKLICHSGNAAEITPQDIAEISTPTLESRIFDLLKAMATRRTGTAIKMYNDMLNLKESPFMVLSMVTRQLRLILLCKCLAEKNTPRVQIAKELKIHDFVVGEAISQAKNFTSKELIAALENCQSTDIRIKSGLITPELGVEMLLMPASQVG